jgi:hypothetical protein
MNKSILEKNLTNSMNENFDKVSKYLEPRFEVFCELDSVVYEVNNCLILGLHKASITLTNYLLERLLKIALIYNEAGIGPVEDLNNLDDVFREPNEKYNAILLSQSIKKCKEFELVTESETEVLDKKIRDLLRNGFSHADSTKILKDLPSQSKMFQGSFSNPTGELKEITINTKINPVFQAIHMSEYALQNALPYYDFVFNLVFRIEKRLKEKAS